VAHKHGRELIEKELKTVERELNESAQIVNDLNQRRQYLEKRAHAIRNQLSYYAPKKLQVSDHCLLRYLERYYNLDMNQYREEVLKLIGQSENNVGSIKFAGFVIKNGVVITYYPPGEKPDAST
jgi:F0F1-type ATP synthase membrane subunit b/b'